MNADRFDAVSHIVTRAWGRRGLVRAMMGIAAAGGLLPLFATPASAKKKRKKKRCAPCQLRSNGRCRGAKPNGVPCGECGICLNGICNPAAIDCGTCRFCDYEARCRVAADDSPCLVGGVCVNGVCLQSFA